MTVFLTSFLDDLMKTRNERANADEGCVLEVVIVDDNAQLTKENRLQNSLSFASNGTGSSSHLSSRWCSQPALQSCSSISTKSKTTCTSRSSCGSNECWEADRVRSPISVALLGSSGSRDAMGQDQEQLSRNHKSHLDISAPKCPSRGKLPCSGNQHVLLDRNKLLSLKPPSLKLSRNSSAGSERERPSKLRDALGSMAPSSLALESSVSEITKSSFKGKKGKKRGDLASSSSGDSPLPSIPQRLHHTLRAHSH